MIVLRRGDFFLRLVDDFFREAGAFLRVFMGES
jgi:hypothetical protein